ncbi:hypothetical protein [Propioniciclava sp.]|uniref:hypothetical protein n=1 Tax=Propioniciclava sp. TaxID=2038686 RepID=UPI00262F5C7D|nr:hypothetical protein [Propioniciclava sp.]
METTTHVLRPRVAVRAFVVAAALAVVGAGLTVGASAAGWPAWLAAGGVLVLAAAVALVVAAAITARRQQVTIELDADGYRITEPGRVRSGLWAEVSKVTGAPGRLTLHHGVEQRVQLFVTPERTSDLDAVAADIGRLLDRSRGYRNYA